MIKYKVTYMNGTVEIVEADFLNGPSMSSSQYEFHRYYDEESSKGEKIRPNRIHLSLNPYHVREVRRLEDPSDPKVLTIGEDLGDVLNAFAPGADSVVILRNGSVAGTYRLLNEE